MSLTTAGIDASGSGAKTMDVDGNWFYGCGKAFTAASWVSGTFGASNNLYTGDMVEINDPDSMCIVEIPVRIFTEAQAGASAARVPGNYLLSNAVIRRAPRLVYAASAGLTAPIAMDAATSAAVPEFYYSGGNGFNGAGFNVPFVTQILNNGFSMLDTQIIWSDCGSPGLLQTTRCSKTYC